MKHKGFILTIAFLIILVVNTVSVFTLGNTYTYNISRSDQANIHVISITPDKDGIVKTESINGGKIKFSAKEEGFTNILLECREDGNEGFVFRESISLYTTGIGTIVCLAPHFDFNGSIILAISITVYILITIIVLILSVKASYKVSFYSYKNILYVGFIIFLTLIFCILSYILSLYVLIPGYHCLSMAVQVISDSAQFISAFLFPIITVVFLSISISNLSLIRHEGKSIKNLLGFIIGAVFLISPIFMHLSWRIYSDIGNFSKQAALIQSFAANFISYLVIYFATIHRAKLKIIYIDKFRIDAIFLYKNKKSLLTWYNDYFIEMDLTHYVDDEILETLLEEIMNICSDYYFYKIGG